MTTSVELRLKASKVKLVAFDVDGVMTDGSLTFVEDGREIKTFNAKDGQGIVMLNRAGLKTAIITARDNNTVRIRAKILGITRLFEGQKNKCLALEGLAQEFGLNYDEIAYMGDDYPDLCVLKQVGLAACPEDAIEEVVEVCDFVAKKGGGKGAVRELCNFILKSQNIGWCDVSGQ